MERKEHSQPPAQLALATQANNEDKAHLLSCFSFQKYETCKTASGLKT